jgi:hypothetical protein
MKKSPIYLFYEIVANGADGKPGDEGDVHYRCLYGTHKICMIKRSMKCNFNGVFSFLGVLIYLSQPIISSCGLSARPREADVPFILHPPRPR